MHVLKLQPGQRILFGKQGEAVCLFPVAVCFCMLGGDGKVMGHHKHTACIIVGAFYEVLYRSVRFSVALLPS